MAKILLVEDNEMNRDMLSRRLERKGYQVIVAVDGGEGLAKARDEMPDLILMDMSLPVVDGWEATRQLKSQDPTRTIPVVVVTAVDLAPEDLDRLEGRVDRVLQKGANIREGLLGMVRELVGGY